MTTECKVMRIDDLAEGHTEVVSFVVSQDDMARFAELSGDFNPLHTDDEFARAKKFSGAVVYGALTIAKVSQLIGMRLPGRDSVWMSISMDFKKPLYVGQLAEAEGVVSAVSVATGVVELRLTTRVDGKVISKGRAEVVVVPA